MLSLDETKKTVFGLSYVCLSLAVKFGVNMPVIGDGWNC